jgi:hypothetical protein
MQVGCIAMPVFAAVNTKDLHGLHVSIGEAA